MHAIDIHLKCYKASSIDLSYPSQCSLFTVCQLIVIYESKFYI